MQTRTFFPRETPPPPERGTTSDRLGLYIHLPFCRTKCTYCAFVSGAPRSDDEMDTYLQALLRQWDSASDVIRGRELQTVFFGGGTPSLMGAERLECLLQRIRENARIAPGAEVTLEANPESATTDLVSRLMPLGLNRISLGAQTFHEDELARLGRVHSADEIRRAVVRIHEAGIRNLSIDLIYGLPGQSFDRWVQNVQQALQLPLQHLSAYALSFEEGTLLHRLHQKGTVMAAGDDLYEDMYLYLQDTLKNEGFHHYEISNWCRPGMESHHNRLYWNRDEYCSLGVSAHGMLNGIRYSWIRSPADYTRCLLSPDASPGFWRDDLLDEYERLTSDVAASDGMIFGLRLAEGIGLKAFQQRYGYSPTERWGEAIRILQERDLLRLEGERLHIPPDRFLMSNEVLMHFID